MKKRILSFLLVLVLLFNAVAVFAFAQEGEEELRVGDRVEQVYEPMTPQEVLETVGTANFLGGSSFENTDVFKYAKYASENYSYYILDGETNTPITDEERIRQIREVLTLMGDRIPYGGSSPTISGKKITYINNSAVINLVTEGDNSYISMSNPLTYEQYKTVVPVRYTSGSASGTLVRGEDKYNNATYGTLDFSSNLDSAISAGLYNKNLAFSFDFRAGDLKAEIQDTSFVGISYYYINNSQKETYNDLVLMKIRLSEDGTHTVTARVAAESGSSVSWEEIEMPTGTDDFTRMTLLINPIDNTYDIMMGGVIIKEDLKLLTDTERGLLPTDESGNKIFAYKRSRSFYVGVSTFDLIGNKTWYSIDNVMVYLTDNFIEHAHNYVIGTDCCYECTVCGEAFDCIDTGVEETYTDGDFGDKIVLSHIYYKSEEDKENKVNGTKELKIGSAGNYKGEDFFLSLNNRMGVFKLEDGRLVMGEAVSPEYYNINVGDDKQHNEVYLVFNNSQSGVNTSDLWNKEGLYEQYAGRSMLISGSFQGAKEFNFQGVETVSINLLNLGAYYTNKSSISPFYLATLEITKGEQLENGKYAAVYTVKTAMKNNNGTARIQTICTLSADEVTDIAAFVNPVKNTVEFYVNGERVLEEYGFTFIDMNSSTWKTIFENKVIDNGNVTITSPADLIISSSKCCALAASIFSAKDTENQYTYEEVTGDFLYIDSIDMVYAEEYNKNYKTNIKDGYCDKCGKAMLDVEQRNVALDSAIALNYYVDIADAILNNATVTLTNGKNTVSIPAADGEIAFRGARKYTFNMTAIDMAKPVEIRVSVGDKTSAVYASSVADYAINLINSTDIAISAEAKALAKAMLNYGAAAQTYLAEYKEAPELSKNLANANLGDNDKVVPDAPTDFYGELPNYIYLKPDSASLILEGQLKLRIYYTERFDNYTVTATITKNGVTTEAAVGDIIEDVKEGYFAITIEDLTPSEYDAIITVNLDSKDGHDATLELSVNTVIGLILTNEDLSANFKSLARALYDYHIKAVAYEGAN